VEVKSLYREPESREEIAWGALEFHDVFKIYRSGPVETVALRGLDLRVEPRELVALFGPSGSGKSTALQLAAGLDEPSAGEVRVFGRSLTRLDEAGLVEHRSRGVAVIFQSNNLWPQLTAHENVALTLRLGGRQDAAAAANILSGPLKRARLSVRDLAAVQRRRDWPTRITQAIVTQIQNRILGPAITGGRRVPLPPAAAVLLRLYQHAATEHAADRIGALAAYGAGCLDLAASASGELTEAGTLIAQQLKEAF